LFRPNLINPKPILSPHTHLSLDLRRTEYHHLNLFQVLSKKRLINSRVEKIGIFLTRVLVRFALCYKLHAILTYQELKTGPSKHREMQRQHRQTSGDVYRST
jgi:hypothetical protein